MLDSPPPSPAVPASEGAPLSAMGGGGMVPTAQLPPEILVGVTNAAGTITDIINSFAQIMPDKASGWMLILDLIQRQLGELLSAGAPASSPTSTGQAFPGGGLGQGIAGAGTQ